MATRVLQQDDPPPPSDEIEPELIEDEPEGGAPLTLGEHLTEVRQRLTIATLTIVLFTVVTLVFAADILDYLLEPGRRADPGFRPIYTELLGYVGAYIKISLLLGLASSMPVIIYQIYAFLHPGLTRSERKWIIPIVALATIAFAGGGAFAFYVGWPPALVFLLNFGSDIAEAQVRINNYVDMLTRLSPGIGVRPPPDHRQRRWHRTSVLCR